MCAHLNSPCVSGGVSSQQFAFGEADVGPRRPRNPPLSKQAASLAASSCHPSPPCLQRTRDHRVPGHTAAVPSSQAICRTCCTAQQSSAAGQPKTSGVRREGRERDGRQQPHKDVRVVVECRAFARGQLGVTAPACPWPCHRATEANGGER